MARCDYCNSYILFGGEQKSGRTFCNDDCLQAGRLMRVADRLPQHSVDAAVSEAHQGDCPLCHGPGPIDVHTSHTIWSIIAMTSWRSTPHVCCRSCGRQKQLSGLVTSGLFGWWGFPWGLIYTPVQIGKNLSGLLGGPDPEIPSEQLETMTRLELAVRVDAGEPMPGGQKSLPAGSSSSADDDRIPVECDDCGKRFKAKAAMAGKSGKCPGCGSVITVPEPDYWLDDGDDDSTGDEWADETYDDQHDRDYDDWEQPATSRRSSTSRRKNKSKKSAITPLRIVIAVGLLLFVLPILGAVVVGVVGLFADRRPQPEIARNNPAVLPDQVQPAARPRPAQNINRNHPGASIDAQPSAVGMPGNSPQLLKHSSTEPEAAPVPPLENTDPDGPLWVVLSNFRQASRQGFGSINRRWLIDYQVSAGSLSSEQKYVLHVSKSLGGGSFTQYSDTPVQLKESGTIEFGISPAIGAGKNFVATIATVAGNRKWKHVSGELAPNGSPTTTERPPTIREIAGSGAQGKTVAIANPVFERGTGPFPTLTVRFELLKEIDQTHYYMLVAESSDGEKLELDIKISLQRAAVGTESQYGARLVGAAASLKPPFSLYVEKRKTRFISPVRPETPEVVSNKVRVAG